MSHYTDYVRKMQRIADIQHAVAIMHWDKETYLPAGASRFRSQQIATLSSLAHEMFTEASTGTLLRSLLQSQGLQDDQKRNLELSLRDYEKEVCLPADFVERLSMAQAESFTAWLRAREKNDFTLFAPALQRVVELRREEAELRGYSGERYDALLDVYEPGLTAARVDQIFDETREKIIPLIRHIRKRTQPDPTFLRQFYPRDRQWQFGLDVLQAFGYRFDHGRQDISAHPFTISFSPEDVRITTRIDEYDFSNMFWSTVHECGHALYEQGLPADSYGLPLGAPASLAMHESQSRLWENQVARSAVFWESQLPRLKRAFPEQLNGIDPEHFFGAINHIAPNLIRTEADELHYHLHVLIRYEIERDLVNTEHSVDALPDIWKAKYKAYLDVEVPDDKRGILQDVHWSHGSFGYFPTYSLGSFYAAQLFHQAQRDIPDLSGYLANGEYHHLHEWLADKVYRHGRALDPEDLCREITGRPLDITDFVDYAIHKYEVPIHELK